MFITMVKEDPCWVQLQGASRQLIANIKATVRPSNRRKYDVDSNMWSVHWHWLSVVATLAKNLGHTIDWSALPERWQMVAAGACTAADAQVMDQVSNDPFDVLYITTDAPQVVIKAAYKALVSVHHPDVGGNVKDFQKIDDAYKRILKLKDKG